MEYVSNSPACAVVVQLRIIYGNRSVLHVGDGSRTAHVEHFASAPALRPYTQQEQQQATVKVAENLGGELSTGAFPYNP